MRSYRPKDAVPCIWPTGKTSWESSCASTAGRFWRISGRSKREVAEKLALEQYEQYDAHRRALEAADDVDELTADVKRLKR